jgi:hypothetical protein
MQNDLTGHLTLDRYRILLVSSEDTARLTDITGLSLVETTNTNSLATTSLRAPGYRNT